MKDIKLKTYFSGMYLDSSAETRLHEILSGVKDAKVDIGGLRYPTKIYLYLMTRAYDNIRIYNSEKPEENEYWDQVYNSRVSVNDSSPLMSFDDVHSIDEFRKYIVDLEPDKPYRYSSNLTNSKNIYCMILLQLLRPDVQVAIVSGTSELHRNIQTLLQKGMSIEEYYNTFGEDYLITMGGGFIRHTFKSIKDSMYLIYYGNVSFENLMLDPDVTVIPAIFGTKQQFKNEKIKELTINMVNSAYILEEDIDDENKTTTLLKYIVGGV